MADTDPWIAKAVVLERNLDIQDRRYRLKTYKNCFVGSAAVYVIISLKYANSAEDAVKFANKLMELKIIKHVANKQPFKNEELFYTFVPGYRVRNVQFNANIGLFSMAQRLSLTKPNQNDDDNDTKEDKKEDIKLPSPPKRQRHRPSTPSISISFERRMSKLSGHERDALSLFDLIVNGSLFYYPWNESLIHDQTQRTLIKYLESYMNEEKDLEDFNLNYFQSLFLDKIKRIEQHNHEIFINIEQISSLHAEIVSFFFDVNNKDFKGKLFFKGIFAVRDDFRFQLIEMPEIIHLTNTQLMLVKDEKYFGDVLFKKFEVTNKEQESFKFYLKAHRVQDGDKFNISLYLKSKPENYGKVKIMWDFVCTEASFQNIGKCAELNRNKCDEIEGFATSSMSKVGNRLTFIVNIRVVS
eukprot:256785_1